MPLKNEKNNKRYSNLLDILTYHIPLYNGPIVLPSLEDLQLDDISILNRSVKVKRKKPEKKIYMINSAFRNKNRINIDGGSSIANNILTIPLYDTEENNIIKPFWNPYCRDVSNNILSTSDTNPLMSMLSRKPILIKNIPNSNIHMIQRNTNVDTKLINPKMCPSFTAFEFTQNSDPINLNDPTTLKIKIAKMIKFKPSKELKSYLNRCFGTHRYFYNKCVATVNKKYSDQYYVYKNRRTEQKCCYKIDAKNNIFCEQSSMLEHKNTKNNIHDSTEIEYIKASHFCDPKK